MDWGDYVFESIGIHIFLLYEKIGIAFGSYLVYLFDGALNLNEDL